MTEKYRSQKEFFFGVQIDAMIEVSNEGCGNSYCPTTIKIKNQNAQIEYSMDKLDMVSITSCGEMEQEVLPDVFIWIGKELKRIYQELDGDDDG